MAQPSSSPAPNVLKPPNLPFLPAQLPTPLFYPRKEFLRDQPRVVSAFAILTLAGTGFVRLYSFQTSVIEALHQLFVHLIPTLTIVTREVPETHFFEFSLDSKPWAKLKDVASEKLIVAILTVISQYGYSFVSTIDYAREHDDRIAIAFSRPSTAPVNSSLPTVPNPNASCSTLPQAGPLLFAISFASTSILHVIEPPLPLTPAILQAVRNAWPRGVDAEIKRGNSYEFKFKGYKWFEENNFPSDSLQQILMLLGSFDRLSFTLLTSLTLGNRSRTRDLWIFIGPPSQDSPPASPVGLGREGIPRHTTSPLKQVTPSSSSSGTSKLKKPPPNPQLTRAYQSDSSLFDHSLDNHGKLPSEVGSVDMTGVGTAHRRGGSEAPPSDAFYETKPMPDGNSCQVIFNPWIRSVPNHAVPTNAPPAPSSWKHSRHYSLSSTDDPLLRGVNQDSPYDVARQSQSSSSNSSRLRRASSPLSTSSLGLNPSYLTPACGVALRHSKETPKTALLLLSANSPRDSTPPLLGSGAFRDSGLSSSTGCRSGEVPITWTGKEPDPTLTISDARCSPARAAPNGPRERRASTEARSELKTSTPPFLERRGSSGPMFPGSWATPKEEQNPHDILDNAAEKVKVDVGTTSPATHTSSSSYLSPTMIPPTIKEQFSEEKEQSSERESMERRGNVRVHVPEQHRAAGEGARKSEAAWVGNTNITLVSSFLPQPGMPSPANNHADGNANGEAQGPSNAGRSLNPPQASSISEGWVIINVDSSRKGRALSPTGSSGQGSSLSAPRLKHQRSQSDSRIPTSTRTTPMNTGKPIKMDAVDQTKKQQSGGKLRRLLGRTPDKGKDKDNSRGGHASESSTSSYQSRTKQMAPGQVAKARK